MQIYNIKQNIERRRALRKNPTEPEKRFWSWVRGQQLGVKFRRQQGIGAYIVDFYCAELKLVIELDGDSHYTADALVYDAQRDDFLRQLGLTVLRFSNQDIMQNKQGVLQKVVSFQAVDSRLRVTDDE